KWFIRVWDYPRFQMFGIILAVTITAFLTVDLNQWENLVCLVLLMASLLYLDWIVYPYTVLSKKMVASQQQSTETPKLKLLTINVYQYNRLYQKTLDLIYQSKPDIVFLLETDENWKESVQ